MTKQRKLVRLLLLCVFLALGIPASAFQFVVGGGGGGSNAPTPTAIGDMLMSTNGSTFALFAAGANGLCLVSNGVNAAPSYQSCAAGSTGISGATNNGAMFATSATSGTSTAALTNGQLLIGSTGVPPVAGSIAGTAAEITATGGAGTVTLSLPTALTFTGKTVTNGTFVNPALGTPASGVATNLTGTAAGMTAGTATALAANGANCSAGSFPLGVDALGASESCTALPTTLTGTANQVAVSAATGAITLSIPSSPTLPGTTTGTFSGNVTGNVTGSSGSTTGNAATATALAANGANCSAGSFPLGVDASGAAESCTALPTTITGTAGNITASASTGAITLNLGTTPALGTPASGVATNLTGTAAGLTAGTVTTNANLTGDVTSSGNATTLANIPTAIPMAGTIVGAYITAPGTPAASKDALYIDSTDLRFHDKNASGTIGTTVVADTGASNNFLTAISAAGVVSKAQPSFSNLSSTLLSTQMVALTGDVTNTAGSVATTIANAAVTYAKMQSISGASLLVGRGSAGGAGSPQEITLGTNLSMSGTTLNSSAGAGGYATVQEEGAGLTARTKLNFIGSAVTCVDNAGTTTTDCTITGGSGITSLGSQTGATQTITRGAGIAGTDSGDDHSFTTASNEADFLASGALTCGAATQGKAQVHTTPLQYCDNAATPALKYAAYGDSAGKATTAALADTATDTVTKTGTGSTYATSASPVFTTPTLGVASATSLATSAASPLLLTNGQLVTVALTSQTVGGATLTIPDFANVADEFTFKTKAQTMSNKTFVAPALGTPASGVMTNVSGTAANLTAGTVTTNANLTGGVTSAGNAVTLKRSCQPGLGDGLNAIASGTYPVMGCLNDFGSTWTVTGIKCYADAAGATVTIVANSAASNLLSGTLTCGTGSFAAGSQSGTTTIASADYVKITMTSNGTPKNIQVVVTGTF